MTAAISSQPCHHRFSVADYHRMAEVGILRRKERVELIDRQIIRKAPITPLHAATVSRVARHFHQLVNRAIVWVQSPVHLDTHDEPEPDTTLLKPQSDFYESGLPEPDAVLLMLEVADVSLIYDLGDKRSYYARHRISELWVIDAVRKIIHVCHDPHEGEYRTITQMQGDDLLAPLALSDFVAPVRAMIG